MYITVCVSFWRLLLGPCLRSSTVQVTYSSSGTYSCVFEALPLASKMSLLRCDTGASVTSASCAHSTHSRLSVLLTSDGYSTVSSSSRIVVSAGCRGRFLAPQAFLTMSRYSTPSFVKCSCSMLPERTGKQQPPLLWWESMVSKLKWLCPAGADAGLWLPRLLSG